MFCTFLPMLTFYCLKLWSLGFIKGKNMGGWSHDIDCFLYHKISSSDSLKKEILYFQKKGKPHKHFPKYYF